MRIHFLTLAILASAPAVAAQARPRAAATRPRIVVETEQRWLHGRQRAELTPMAAREGTAEVLATRRDPRSGGRTLDLAFRGDFAGTGSARLTTDARGRVVRLEASFPPPRPATVSIRALVSPAEELRWAIFDGIQADYAALPETRVWDLVPTLPPGGLARGARWRDTLDLTASLAGFRQTLRGVRESVVLGDTLVGGVRLWVVRDSARVRYMEHLLVEERTLDTIAVVERSAEGTVVGTHLLDPGLGLDRRRADTTALTGEAVLRYPDGRSFRTPARYDRRRSFEWLDAAAFHARQERRAAAWGEFSIVMRPEGDAEHVARGDSGVVAALLDTIATTRDPDARGRARGLLEFAADPAMRERVRSALLRAGDTVSVVRDLENAWLGDAGPVNERDLAVLLPIMADPGVAFAFGVERDPHYENARQGLLAHPPATTSDTARWPCTPAACRMLAAQWTAAVDPRLRSLALVARLAMDPRAWADTVLAGYAAGDAFLAPAVSLLHGVATTWAAGSRAELPRRGADWRSWSAWMDGRNAGAGAGAGSLARFEDTHANVIAFARALTGRDFAGEWRAALRSATGDSARVVYGRMLVGVGQPPDDPAAIATMLVSGSPLLQDLARSELRALFEAGAPVADSATVEEVQGRVLDVALADAAPWPVLDPRAAKGRNPSPMPRRIAAAMDVAYDRPEATPGPVVLTGDALAPAVRERWAARNVRIESGRWDPPSSVSAIVVTVSDVRRIGPFVRVSLDQSHLTARVGGRGQSWASGTTLYLMRRGQDWVIVSSEGWIT